MARPLIHIDWKKVAKLLEADCLGSEIAANIGISQEALYKRCQRDNKMNFSEYRRQHLASGASLLKVAQFKAALEGDKTMLVWLGKQRLGQRDKLEVENKIEMVTQQEKEKIANQISGAIGVNRISKFEFSSD